VGAETGAGRVLRQVLLQAGALPSRYAWRNPFKIIEYEALVGQVDVRPTDVVLDLGCGSGPQDLLLARRAARVIGIDVSAREIERAEARAAVYGRGCRVEFRCTPIEHAGFATHQFDKVFSFCVLEHIANREEVFATIARVLKPRGILAISVDSLAGITDPQLIAKHRSDHRVITYFTPPELESLLARHGFAQIRIWPIFRGPYARKLFEAGIEREFVFDPVRKFGSLARLKLEELIHAQAGQGMFLCATAARSG
jgi:SAM-dependent methyltransferase